MISYTTLLKNRRSVRDFLDKKIAPEVLQELLQDACIAPSAMNTQPWRFIIIQDQDVIKRISDESKKNLVAEIEASKDSNYRKYVKYLKNPTSNVFYNAPCLILVCGENNYQYFTVDCTLAVAYLMFAATARGLGTCWIGLGSVIKDRALRHEIGLPDDYEIVAPIIIGYPQILPESYSRKDPIVLKHL